MGWLQHQIEDRHIWIIKKYLLKINRNFDYINKISIMCSYILYNFVVLVLIEFFCHGFRSVRYLSTVFNCFVLCLIFNHCSLHTAYHATNSLLVSTDNVCMCYDKINQFYENSKKLSGSIVKNLCLNLFRESEQNMLHD